MRKAIGRILVLGAVQLLLFELVEQLSVHRRESTGELLTIALMVAVLLGSIWAVVPGFAHLWSRTARVGLRGVAALVLFAVLYAGDYYYSWHLRPNLGLYREPDWVAQHPDYQRDVRERIDTNTWRADSKKLP